MRFERCKLYDNRKGMGDVLVVVNVVVIKEAFRRLIATTEANMARERPYSRRRRPLRWVLADDREPKFECEFPGNVYAPPSPELLSSSGRSVDHRCYPPSLFSTCFPFWSRFNSEFE